LEKDEFIKIGEKIMMIIGSLDRGFYETWNCNFELENSNNHMTLVQPKLWKPMEFFDIIR
jgi:hypothetical protein